MRTTSSLGDAGPRTDTIVVLHRIGSRHKYPEAVAAALDDGLQVASCLMGALMDNSESAYAYGQRFGLAFVDYESRQRALKDSAYWCHENTVTQRVSLHSAGGWES